MKTLPEIFTLPFLTRKMVDFDESARFDLELGIISGSTSNIILSGATRQSPFSFTVKPTAATGIEQFILGVDDFPMFVSLNTAITTFTVGSLYATCYLRSNGIRLLKLFSGYLSSIKGLSWPAVMSEDGVAPHEITTILDTSNPAANTQYTATVGNSAIWILDSIALRLVTAVAVANRRVHVQIQDNSGNVIYEFWSSQDQAASLTYDYHFQRTPYVSSVFDNLNVVVPIPDDLVLNSGWKVVTAVTNWQAADDFGGCSVYGQVRRRAW